jgi:hypothetical protein
MDLDNQLQSSRPAPERDTEAIRYLQQAVSAGEHWYIALLRAVGLWGSVEETYNGRTCRYLIAGEAFDWLLLAERLCEAVDSLVPADEKLALLVYGEPPLDLTTGKFKGLIGSSKYHQYLNYFYGITVEEALISAVQEEIRKERRTSGYNTEEGIVNEVYRRIYGATKAVLLKRFRREKGYPQLRSISLTELKEFTYWLFKYRLKQGDRARVASDTKKALERLKQQWAGKGFSRNLITVKPPSIMGGGT